MTLFIWLVIIALGVFLVIKTEWVYSFTGPIDWAEEHLGAEGGTRMFLKIIGIIVIVGALLWVTGAVQAILGVIFSPLTRSFEKL